METPYYLIDEKILEDDVNLLLNSFIGNWENHICAYSVKTNSTPWILNYLKNKGFYAEIVSEDEYHLVKKIGYSDDKIIYNGPIKNKDVIEKILLSSGYVNIDSHDEISFIKKIARNNHEKKIKIGIRINCDFKKISSYEFDTEQDESRFGFYYFNGEVKKLLETFVESKNIEVIGLHLHTETKQRAIEGYQALVEFAHKIASENNLQLEYVDIGGGYFGGLKNKPTFNDYIPDVSKTMQKCFSEKTALIVEPGVSLIAHPVFFHTSVKDIKQIENKRFVITDGSRLNLNPLTKYKSYLHHLELQKNKKREQLPSQMICGFTCMESDRMFELTDSEELIHGDKIIYENAGAYTICLSPLFINYFPAIYVQKKDGSIFTARKKWTVDEYMSKNYI